MNLSWLLLAATIVVVSQTPGRPSEDLVCRQAQPANPTLTKTLSNGAVVTVRSVTPNSLGQTCEVTVRDRSGKVVFEDRGFNTSIDPATGRDIDNDGQPDAVVGIDTIGRHRKLGVPDRLFVSASGTREVASSDFRFPDQARQNADLDVSNLRWFQPKRSGCSRGRNCA